MSAAGVGAFTKTGTDYQQKSEEEVIFRTYSYQNGKGQEKVYYRKDCVEISMGSYTVSTGSDNYEEIKNMLNRQSSGKITFPGNRMFSETQEVMEDYYSGKLSSEEVKNIFKEYFYYAMGTTLKEREEGPV